MHRHADLYPWVSAAAIAWGLLDVFFGYRVFKVTIALFGGLVGAWAAQQAAQALVMTSGLTLALVVAGGLLGATLAFLLYIAAVFVAGFGFGATLGILLLANFNHAVALATGLILGVVGGFLAVKIQKILIMLSTALLGAFRAILALSYFTSQIDWVYYFRQPQQIPVLVDNNPWMFPAILALAATGFIAQFGLGSGGAAKDAKKNKDK